MAQKVALFQSDVQCRNVALWNWRLARLGTSDPEMEVLVEKDEHGNKVTVTYR